MDQVARLSIIISSATVTLSPSCKDVVVTDLAPSCRRVRLIFIACLLLIHVPVERQLLLPLQIERLVAIDPRTGSRS